MHIPWFQPINVYDPTISIIQSNTAEIAISKYEAKDEFMRSILGLYIKLYPYIIAGAISSALLDSNSKCASSLFNSCPHKKHKAHIKL